MRKTIFSRIIHLCFSFNDSILLKIFLLTTITIFISFWLIRIVFVIRLLPLETPRMRSLSIVIFLTHLLYI